MMIRWLIYFIPAVLIELLSMVLTPFVCMFVTKRDRTDYSKRIGTTVTMQREYLINIFYWFQTHDNAVDEYWYGLYDDALIKEFGWTQEDYDSNPLIRYYCRVRWCWRNAAYGFHYNIFGMKKEVRQFTLEAGFEHSPLGWLRLDIYLTYFHFQLQLPQLKNRETYKTYNIGWKEHKGFPRVMYANRVISATKDYK